MEHTRRSQDGVRFLLITTNIQRVNAQREADNILNKYYKRKPSISNYNSQDRGVTPITPTHFATYADTIVSIHFTTNFPNNITRPSVLNQRLVAISFSNINPSPHSSYGYPSPRNYNFNNQENKSVYGYISITNPSTPNDQSSKSSSNYNTKKIK